MGYLHIENLYKPSAQQILAFKELYALEKIHGTSAHVAWFRDDASGHLTFFSGGERHDRFVALFNQERLAQIFEERVGLPTRHPTIIYGEAYGGKQQGMSGTYGPQLKFIAFDVSIDGCWLSVPQAADFVRNFSDVMSDGSAMEFVDYVRIPASLAAIDAERDRPSAQAIRNGILEPKIREGVVLRPPFEVSLNHGARLIAKHKRDEFRETASPRVVTDPAKLRKLEGADAIAMEWVTPARLEHVIAQLIAGREYKRAEMSDIPQLIRLMQEDVYREGRGEIVEGKEVARAIGGRTVALFKAHLQRQLTEVAG